MNPNLLSLAYKWAISVISWFKPEFIEPARLSPPKAEFGGPARLSPPKAEFGGFSLAEMLIVFALMTALSTIIIIRYGRLAVVLRLDQSTHQVVLALRRAQQFAITSYPDPGSTGVPCAWGVRIDSSAGHYRIFPDRISSGACPGNGFYEASENVSSSIPISILPTGVRFQGSSMVDVTYLPPDPSVRIFKDGILLSDQFITITLEAPQAGESRNIVVWRSGQISIQRP